MVVGDACVRRRGARNSRGMGADWHVGHGVALLWSLHCAFLCGEVFDVHVGEVGSFLVGL